MKQPHHQYIPFDADDNLTTLGAVLSESAPPVSRSGLAHNRGWDRINDRIHSQPDTQRRLGWWVIWAPASVVALAVMLVLVAQGSLPGDPAYPVKRAVENAQVALVSSDAQKADACSAQMKRRANELASLSGSQLTLATTQQLSQSILTEAAEFNNYIQRSGASQPRLTDQRRRDVGYVINALESAKLHMQSKLQLQLIDQTIQALGSEV